MYSICIVFVCVLGLCTVSGFEWPDFGNSGPHESSIKRKVVKTPLTFFLPTLGIRLLNYTGNSMETIPNSKTPEFMTGGILGDAKYQIVKGQFFWEHGTNGTRLTMRFYFYNIKYASFRNALRHRDGISIVLLPVETNDCTYNPLFDSFGGKLEKHIKRPGDSVFINDHNAYKWYDRFSYDSVYTSYKGSFYDEEIGETLSDVTIFQFPKLDRKNFISNKQFADTFGSLRDCSGQPLENPLPEIDHDPSSVVELKAICRILIPV